MTILDVRDLQITFTDDEKQSHVAVDKVNFSLKKR